MKYTLHRLAVAVMAVMLFTGCSKLTKENYDQVKVGMTKDQVIELLGKPGDKSETEIPGLGLGKLESWTWNNVGYGGKVVMVSFQNGKVSDKSWHE
jgi:hypothetical protein